MESRKNTLHTVITLVLGVTGLALVLVSVFNENISRWVLTAGMACIALGALLNSLRLFRQKKDR